MTTITTILLLPIWVVLGYAPWIAMQRLSENGKTGLGIACVVIPYALYIYLGSLIGL